MGSGDSGSESWPGEWGNRERDDSAPEDGDSSDAGTDERADGWRYEDGRSDDRETNERASDGNEAGNGRAGSGRMGSGPLARVRWFLNTDEEWVAFVREVLSSLAIVALVGLVLFAVSGLWPPMVAIESGSMQPNMEIGDLVFVMEEHRFAGGAAYDDTGVVPFRAGAGAGYKEFNEYGDVIVYRPDGDTFATPIIHRARFWVSGGENWYDKANQAYLGGAENCEELANCPAPHGGFITKGDNNGQYDQVGSYGTPISSPVRPSWVTGTAEFRIPWLGRIRLLFGMVSGGVGANAGAVGAWSGVGALAAIRARRAAR